MNAPALARTEVLMGTLVNVRVIRDGAEAAMERAFEWFRQVEQCCTRFNPESELAQLTAQVGVPVPASALLYEAVQLALGVAEESGGAFDPTVGHQLEARGFNREHRSGNAVRTPIASDGPVSFRDVRLDPELRTIMLARPLLLDLGAVAKGLAVDLAARELEPFGDFAIDAGGDLYVGGRNARREPWSVGIRHPRLDHELIDSLRVSNLAVCTSGDYERPDPAGGGQCHILDPRSATPAPATASATVVAPSAMLADALATAAFVLGAEVGIAFLERLGVDGLIVTANLECYETRGLHLVR